MLCKYKNILGEPNKGIHSIRLFNIAIMDLLMTIAAAVILGIFVFKGGICIIILLFLSLFFLGIILHRIFCVNTTINKAIFGYV